MRWQVGAALSMLVTGAACASQPEEPVVVDVWFHSAQGVERNVLAAQLADFNAENTAVQAELGLVPEEGYNQRVVEAGDAEDLPCIVDVDGPNLASYAASGYLQPLDEVLDPTIVDDLLPSLLTQGTWEGQLYGAGAFDSGLAMWANRGHLEAAGVRIPGSVDDAWDLEEFDAALDALAQVEGVERPLDLKLEYGVGEWFTFGYSPFVQAFGGDLVDERGKATGTLDGAASVAGLSWFASLLEDGHSHVPSTDDDFVSGRSSLSWVGHWMWPAYRDALGDDLLLLPAPIGPARQVTGMGSWQWSISSTCEHPEAAGQLLSYLLSPEEILRTVEGNGAVPGRRSVIAASPAHAPGGPLHVYAAQLESGVAVPRPVLPGYSVITEAFAEAIGSVLDGMPPEEALRRAAERIDGPPS